MPMRPEVTLDAFDALVADALSFQLRDDVRASIDRRVAAMIASRQPSRGFGVAPHLVRVTPRAFAAVVAAMVLLAAAAIAGGTLFTRLIAGAPLLEEVWSRATDVDQHVTSAGYTISLEKVAVFEGRVWVALTISSPKGSADIGRMRLMDTNGIVLEGGTGVGTGDVRGDTAVLFGFKVPDGIAPTAPFVLEISQLEVNGTRISGLWRFSFEP